MEWFGCRKIPELHEEIACVFDVSCLRRPFDGLMLKGGEEITVEEGPYKGVVKKIGIHLLYLDQHGNVTSFPISRKTSAGHKRAKF